MRNRPLNPALRPPPDCGAAYHQRLPTHPRCKQAPNASVTATATKHQDQAKAAPAATPQEPRRAPGSGGVSRDAPGTSHAGLTTADGPACPAVHLVGGCPAQEIAEIAEREEIEQ
jgi:hypothetical protein